MRVRRLLGLVFLALAGCAELPPFDANQAAYIDKPGKTTVQGQAFYRAETGRVIYAAGEWVHLIPATPYAEARFRQIYGEGRYRRASVIDFLSSKPDPDYMAHQRALKADVRGKFKFENVPPGRYFVVTQATWIPENEILPRGGGIYEEVTVKGDERDPIELIVSGK